MKKSLFFPLSGCLLLLCLALSATLFTQQWAHPFTALFQSPDSLPLDALLFHSTVLPRWLMALVAGGALAVAAILLQQVMHNPLASDSTLAVSSGAQTAMLLAIIFAPTWATSSTIVAFSGALVALGAVLWLSAKGGFRPLTVVLAGLVVSLYLSAITSALTVFYSEETRGAAMWGAGSLLQDGWSPVLKLTAIIAAALVAISLIIKPLAIMSLSDEQAAALGIPVKRIRLVALILAAFLSANVAATVGMLGFIGLAAASATRLLGVRTLARQILGAFVLGGLLLWLVDLVLQILAHYDVVDLPAGAVSAVAGVPLLLWLMLRTKFQAALSSRSRQIKKQPEKYGLLLILLIVAIFFSLFIGQTEQGWYVSGSLNVLEWRYPRLLTAMSGGALLATAGVLLQRITHNPMASPELLGISSGAAVGVMTAVLLFNVAMDGWGFWLAGTIGAALTLGAIVWFNHKNGMQPEKVLLTGMALAALASALVQIWAASGDYRIMQMQTWLSGSTYAATPERAWILLILTVVAVGLMAPLQRWLGLLGLDSLVAQSAGVPVAWARWILIVAAAAMTAAATLTIGPLSFVGLLAPQLATMLGARLPRQQLIVAALLGACIMTAADWLGRQIAFPYEIPAGIVATLLGGAYFLVLIRKI
ncbi:Fe(3+)-hydroxamate ABC transporter permease FhuB [Wielerella bovis]|uniref:Fe(3+)-hydroxamate ABC transporter permease FhuB n=1 Tax=Wielerella bovis TaxID=2917790 RepID=UPI00201A01D9|nr:Fe(3+)-hydroxamate ABC transporter permease FhuB [Wielerella bovis]ULJ60127.1 Fe(3+)-hydroxamate ABC transporter permease FhuB [Wielerella bovis]